MDTRWQVRTPGRRAHLAIGAAIALLLLAACSSDDTSAGTSSTTAGKTKESATTTTAVAGASSATVRDAWDRDAQEHRGQDGERFTYDCPPGGELTTLWGVETYTDDSSVCTGAVQVGLITTVEGGEVEIEIAPGLDAYDGATAHGVTSTPYAAWSGSFTFPAAPPGSGEFTVGPESWSRTAAAFRGKDGTRLTVRCSADGPGGSVWGTGTYTDDSSICAAAAHAGLITLASGGSVTIEIAPGESSYAGSVANEVSSSDYGSFSGSFTFPPDQPSG